MSQKIFTRDFVLAFFAQVAFSFVFHLLIPTLPVYLSRLGSAEVEIGLLVGIFGFTSVAFRPLIGKALLRTNEKHFMIAGSLLQALASVAYLFTSLFWPMLIVRVIHGIGFALFHTATITLIAHIGAGSRRGQIISYFSLAMNLAGAAAPPVGVFLIDRFSFTVLFLVCGVLSLLSLSVAYRLGTRQVDDLQDRVAEGLPLLSRKVLPSSIISCLALFVWGALAAFFPLFAIARGVGNPGLFFTVLAVTLILGRALGGRILDLYNKERIILPCLLTSIISMVILAFSETQLMFIVVAAIWGAGQAFLMPSLMLHALERVGSSAGPAMGTFTAVTDLGIFLGPLTMGIVIHFTSYPTMFLCLALIGLVNLGYFHFFVRTKG